LIFFLKERVNFFEINLKYIIFIFFLLLVLSLILLFREYFIIIKKKKEIFYILDSMKDKINGPAFSLIKSKVEEYFNEDINEDNFVNFISTRQWVDISVTLIVSELIKSSNYVYNNETSKFKDNLLEYYDNSVNNQLKNKIINKNTSELKKRYIRKINTED
jgi:hypothetical protein